LEFLQSEFKSGPAVFMIYEQINPNDPFGATMRSNLQKRGCPLLGIDEYPDLSSQTTRFQSIGCSQVDAFDMNTVYSTLLDKSDLARIHKLEIFDEYEEWFLIESHYCIVVAVSESQPIFSVQSLFEQPNAKSGGGAR